MNHQNSLFCPDVLHGLYVANTENDSFISKKFEVFGYFYFPPLRDCLPIIIMYTALKNTSLLLFSMFVSLTVSLKDILVVLIYVSTENSVGLLCDSVTPAFGNLSQ